MGTDFYKAAVPEPVAMLGVRLFPFSLGHLLLLNRFDNAFGKGKTPELADLIQAIIICSQDYRSALADMDNPDLPSLVALWQKKLAPRNSLGFRKKELGFSVPRAMLEFSEYIKDGSSFPVFSVEEGKGGSQIYVPMVQTVKVTLQSKMGFSEDEILNRPWGLCLWDYFTLHAMDGNCKIGDDTDTEELLAKANALHARLNELQKLN